MPVVPVNWLAVLVAAIVSTVIGFLWYGPLFKKPWMALSGMTQEKLDAAKAAGLNKLYFLAFLGALLMSYILSHAVVFASAYLHTSGVSAGLMTGFFNWLGFIAPVTLGVVLWEAKSWKLWLLQNGYYLISLLAMGTILSVWR